MPVSSRRPKRTAIFTTRPEVPAVRVRCPSCDQLLDYEQTVTGGVQPIERWDYFRCRTCGPFVYRDRTRSLRAGT